MLLPPGITTRRAPAILIAAGATIPVIALIAITLSSILVPTVAVRIEGGRTGHTLTELSDGRVLVAGGKGDWGILGSSFVYDPRTNMWTRAGEMITARTTHSAVLLRDGRVRVAGGAIPGFCMHCRYPPSTQTT